MGLIYSQRFGRYIVTILFDMFFTVIMFKMLFSKLVQVAGFTVKGREWIANGFCSALISVVTFQGRLLSVCPCLNPQPDPEPDSPSRAVLLITLC